jgi:hypothetical protein
MEAIQKFTEMLVSVIASSPWSRDASKMPETFSPGSIVETWVQLANKMRKDGPAKAWSEYLAAAQKHVFDFAESTINASREAGGAANALMQVFGVFSPAEYMQQIRQGAYFMSLGTINRSVDFWPYAEEHLRAVCRAALAAAPTAEDAAAALDKTIKSFNWEQHLQRIRECAWLLWKGRKGSPDWDPSGALDDWKDAEQQVRAELSGGSIPPKPDER